MDEIQGLVDKLDSLGEDVRGEIATIRAQIEDDDGQLKQTAVAVEKQETWLKEIEATVNKLRNPMQGGSDYKAALGDGAAWEIEQAELAANNHKGWNGEPTGIWKKPDLAAALGKWIQLKFRKDPRVQSHFGIKWTKENAEQLERLDKVLTVKAPANPMVEQATFGVETVPTPLEAEVLRQIEDAAQVRPLARKLTMRAVTHNIPDLTTGISVEVLAEAADGTNVRPVFGTKSLTAKMVAAFGAISLQLLQDSAIGMLDFWLTLATEQYGLKEDLDFLEGNNAATEIGTGILNAVGVNNIDMPTGVSPQPIDAGDWDAFIDAKYKGRLASTRSRRWNTGWFGAPEAARDLEKLQDSNNRPLLQTPLTGNIFALPEGAVGTFLGFPFYANSQIAINRGGGTDETAVYFGPWGRSLIVGDLTGISIGTSEHVHWQAASIGVRMLKRTAVLVAVPADFTKVDRIQIV